MGTYPKYRKPSGYRNCIHCGKSFKARGMGTHIREAHKMLYKTVVSTVVPDLEATVKSSVIDNSNSLNTQVKPISEDLSKITGKDLTECKRPDGEHLYTDQDIMILYARIIRFVLFEQCETDLFNVFDRMDIIEDFEKRFKCKFDPDVQRANQHIKFGTTHQDRLELMNKYMNLKYSKDIEREPFKRFEGPNSMGQYQCKICGLWFMPYSWFEEKGYVHPNPTCINGERHELVIKELMD
jgi:hypothetical protein